MSSSAIPVAFVGLFRLLWASGAGFGLPDGYAAQSSFDDLWARVKPLGADAPPPEDDDRPPMHH